MKGIQKINLKLFTSKITIMIITILFFSTLGASYAYFAFDASDATTLTGDAATVDLTLDVDRVFPTTVEDKGNMVPQQSVSGSNTSPLSTALKSGCVDDNNNAVCHVYRIHIKNDGGTATEVVDGEVSFYADNALTINSYTTMPNLRWKLVESVDTSTLTNSVLGTKTDNTASSTSVKFISNVTLPTNKEYTYYMIVWFNETGSNQIDQGNTFYGMIEFLSSNGTGVTATFN